MSKKGMSNTTCQKIEAKFMAMEKSDLSIVVSSYFTEAIAACCKKMNVRGKKEVVELLNKNNEFAHGCFRYSMATLITEYLVEVEPSVQRVGYSEEPDVPIWQSPICLVIFVDKKTAALTSLLNALNISIVAELKRLFPEHLSDLKYFLAAMVIDNQDAEKNSNGYKSLINPIITIWKR